MKVCCFVDALTMLSLSRFHKSTCHFLLQRFSMQGTQQPPLHLLCWSGSIPHFGFPKETSVWLDMGAPQYFLHRNWPWIGVTPPSYGQTPACNGNFTSRVSVQSFQNCIFFRKFEGSNVYQHINICRVVEFSFFFLAFFFSFLSLIRCLVAVGYHAVAGWSCYVLLLLGHRNGAWVSLPDDGEP